jgi:tetratricopeptide (TPR) repeat protein
MVKTSPNGSADLTGPRHVSTRRLRLARAFGVPGSGSKTRFGLFWDHWLLAAWKAVLTTVTEQTEPFEQARLLYEQAVFNGNDDALPAADRILNATEAGLALARGRILHARFLARHQEDPQELALFERAAALYHQLGDIRGEGESLFWVGTFHQVVRGDDDAAGPPLERAWHLAQAAGDKLTLSSVIRHLGFAEMAAGRLDGARDLLEESVRLRREIGFTPGVAAGVLALAELAARAGDHDRALALLDEATAIAAEAGAHAILRWAGQARQEL